MEHAERGHQRRGCGMTVVIVGSVILLLIVATGVFSRDWQP